MLPFNKFRHPAFKLYTIYDQCWPTTD